MNLLKAENVQILDHAADWKEAIIQSVLPLEKGGFVTEEYKQAVVANVEEFGPYICIAPHVAMPHARPEQGALQTQVAVTLFREEVSGGGTRCIWNFPPWRRRVPIAIWKL